MQEWYVFRKSIIYHCELILGWTVFYCCRYTPNSVLTSITGDSIIWYLHISFGRSNVQLLLLQGTNMHDSQSMTKDAQNSKGAQSSKEHSAARPDQTFSLAVLGGEKRWPNASSHMEIWGMTSKTSWPMLDWATLDTKYVALGLSPEILELPWLNH